MLLTLTLVQLSADRSGCRQTPRHRPSAADGDMKGSWLSGFLNHTRRSLVTRGHRHRFPLHLADDHQTFTWRVNLKFPLTSKDSFVFCIYCFVKKKPAIMKWEKLKPPEPDDPMCCCDCDGYQCGCSCDCEDLDEAFNRWLKGRPTKSGCQSATLGAMIDHFEISMIPVLVLLPLLLQVAALHYLLGIIILTALPGLVLWYYYATHRKKRQTLFFLTLSLYSLFYMYYLFVTEILPRGDVSQGELCAVTAGMILTIVSLIHTKRGPGFVTNSPRDAQNRSQEAEKDSAHIHESIRSESSSSGSVAELQTTKEALAAKWSRCPVCKITRPPRAGHCRTCGSCVKRMDHHCIWINSCVGQANHRSFLLTLSVFVLTSLYGISLVLCSLCPRQYLMTSLFYCPTVYSQSSTALCFTCAWYSSIVTGGLLYLLVVQVLNISFNVTERESLLALRHKTGQSRLWGLVIDTGEYSRGFYQNWVEFLTMADASVSPCSTLTDLV